MPDTHQIKRYHPPCTLRACFSQERLLTPPLSTNRRTFAPEDDGIDLQAVSGPLDLPVPPKIPKPKGEVTRIKRGGYNLLQASGLSSSLYENIQVRLRS
jgi:hypothetical protein